MATDEDSGRVAQPFDGRPLRVVHVTADHPDPLAPGKTGAVRDLIATAPEMEHVVYSLNRVSWRRGVSALSFGDRDRAVAYGAPPFGLALHRGLQAAAAFIVEDLARRGIKPDLVQAHKLSVEGPIAHTVSRSTGAPLLLSTMGDTDLKILRAKPGMRAIWRTVWGDAAAAVAPAPWTAAALERALGPRADAPIILPFPTRQDAIKPPRLIGPLLRSTFHLASWKRKNALALIQAASRAARGTPDLRLEIVGGGDPDGFAVVAEAVARCGACVSLRGPVAHVEMGRTLNESGGFALASRRETFGLVFVEALLAGAPVLYPAGMAIDGLLPEDAPALPVDAGDVDAIADGLTRLCREEESLKARLARLQEGGLDFLRRPAIGAAYRALLARAAAGRAPAH